MRFVSTNRPPVVVLENVPGLISHDRGETFQKIRGDLQKQQYMVMHSVLKCSDYGIPQMRKRLFVLGFRRGTVDGDVFFDMH